jgi:DnaJ family protein B protein 13
MLFFNPASKRATYDQFGEEGLKGGVPEGSGSAGAWTSGYTFHGNANTVFTDFFGGDNPYQGKFEILLQRLFMQTGITFIKIHWLNIPKIRAERSRFLSIEDCDL